MFHKNAVPVSTHVKTTFYPTNYEHTRTSPRLALVSSGVRSVPAKPVSPKPVSALSDLLAISARRCSSFLSEAAVLVLVLALLDRFLIRGNLTPRWIIGAVALSFLLLVASVLTDLSARRWLQGH